MDQWPDVLGIGVDRIQAHSQDSVAGIVVRQGALAASGFVRLFNRQAALGPLDWRIVPEVAIFAYAGLVPTIAGVSFMPRSRVALGRNWSASVTINRTTRS